MQRRRLGAASKRERLLSKAVLFACIAYVGVNVGRLAVQECRLLEEGRIMGKDRVAQDQERRQLLQQIAEARTNDGVEHVARKVLALARPGEVPVVFLAGAQPRLVPYPVPPTPEPTPEATLASSPGPKDTP